jgi:hypothetical protein
MITPEEVTQRTLEIIQATGDPERAHSLEDQLRHDVLIAINEGTDDPSFLAGLALMTEKLDFHRWAA